MPGTNCACAPAGPNDHIHIFAQPQMCKPLIGATGKPELADGPRFVIAHPVLGAAGLPGGACQDTREVLADPHPRARDMIVDIDVPTRGIYQTAGCPTKLPGSPAEITRPPLLGEHTDDMLASLRGVDEAELVRLHQAGVV